MEPEKPARPNVGRPIVVGFDGSHGAWAALEWAAREAEDHHAELHVVHVDFWDRQAMALPAFRHQKAIETHLLADAVAWVGAAAPDVVVVGRRENPPTGEALVAAARGAGLLVVGASHMGSLERWVLGSVSHYCVEHARCPVVVVHEPSPEVPADGRPDDRVHRSTSSSG